MKLVLRLFSAASERGIVVDPNVSLNPSAIECLSDYRDAGTTAYGSWPEALHAWEIEVATLRAERADSIIGTQLWDGSAYAPYSPREIGFQAVGVTDLDDEGTVVLVGVIQVIEP